MVQIGGVVNDKRTLKAVTRKTGLEFESEGSIHYCTNSEKQLSFKRIPVSKCEYKLKYISGCLYPLLVRIR